MSTLFNIWNNIQYKLFPWLEEELDSLLKAINKSPLGKNAKHIGEVKKGKYKVSMETKIGGNRLVPPASGDLIPRIC